MRYKIVEVKWTDKEDNEVTQRLVRVGRFLFPFMIAGDVADLNRVTEEREIGEVEFNPPMQFKFKKQDAIYKGSNFRAH